MINLNLSADVLLSAPLLIPLLTLCLCIVFSKHNNIQETISFFGSILYLFFSIFLFLGTKNGTILTSQAGSWDAPYGITLVSDLLSSSMILLTGIMAVLALLYQKGNKELCPSSTSRFHPLFHGVLAGVSGSFLTGDIFNLYVWFEIMLISSFGLITIQKKPEQLQAGIKYVIMNLASTAIFLFGVAFLYGLCGTLNMADLAVKIPHIPEQGFVKIIYFIFIFSFAAKAAVFPLFFWLPAAYPVMNITILAFFSALLTKVGIYSLLRFNTLIFSNVADSAGSFIAILAVMTMITGVLGAAAQFDMRRILAFHSISQIGYILIGVAVGTPFAIAGSAFFVIHHSFVKSSLFFISGIINKLGNTFYIKNIGGLYSSHILLSVLFFLQAMSLAGLPPSSGFWAKFILIKASFQTDWILLAITSLFVGVLTLFSMVKIWNEVFLKNPSSEFEQKKNHPKTSSLEIALLYAPVFIITIISVTMGLFAETGISYVVQLGEQLCDPKNYTDAVLNNNLQLKRAQI